MIKLTKSQCAYLGKNIPNQSTLSLFANVTSEHTEDDGKALEKMGVINENEVSSDLLMNIVKSHTMSRLIYQDEYVIMEKNGFRSDKGYTLCENDSGNLFLNDAQRIKDSVYEMSEYFGISAIKQAQFDVELSYEEAYLLLDIIDHYRCESLKSIIDENHKIRDYDIGKVKLKPQKQSYLGIIVNRFDKDNPLEFDIKKCWKRLMDKGVVSDNGLTDEFMAFSIFSLVPKSILLEENFRLNYQGDVEVQTAIVLSASNRSHLLIGLGDETIRFGSLSSLDVLNLTEEFLLCNA